MRSLVGQSQATGYEHQYGQAKAGDEDSDVKSCLQNVSEAKYNEAISVCLEALKSHPDNDQVKEALDEAKAAVSDAAAVATDAAQDAVQDVAQDVQKAAEEKAKGAIDEAIGGLAQ